MAKKKGILYISFSDQITSAYVESMINFKVFDKLKNEVDLLQKTIYFEPYNPFWSGVVGAQAKYNYRSDKYINSVKEQIDLYAQEIADMAKKYDAFLPVIDVALHHYPEREFERFSATSGFLLAKALHEKTDLKQTKFVLIEGTEVYLQEDAKKFNVYLIENGIVYGYGKDDTHCGYYLSEKTSAGSPYPMFLRVLNEKHNKDTYLKFYNKNWNIPKEIKIALEISDRTRLCDFLNFDQLLALDYLSAIALTEKEKNLQV